MVLWRDAAVHRAAPLAILHLTTEQRDNWQPEKGLIKIHAVPDWRGGKVGNRPKWLNPLDKHKEWRPRLITHGSLIFLTVFNIWQRFEITEFLKVDGPSALCLFGPVDPSVCCGVTVRLYEGSENQRVIGQCLELVKK